MVASGMEDLWSQCNSSGGTVSCQAAAAVKDDSAWAGSLGKGTYCILRSTEQQKEKVKSLTFGTAWLTSQWTPQQTAAAHNLYLLLSPACRDPEGDEEGTPVRKVHSSPSIAAPKRPNAVSKA